MEPFLKQFIRFEMKKIAGTRFTILVLLSAMLCNLFLFALNVQEQRNYGGIVEFHGIEAIQRDRQLMGRLKGFLTDEYRQTIEVQRTAIENNPDNLELDEKGMEKKIEVLRSFGYGEEAIAKTPPIMKVKGDVYLGELNAYEFYRSHTSLLSYIPKVIEELREGNIDGIYERRINPAHPVKPELSMAEVNTLLQMYERIDNERTKNPVYYDYFYGWRNLCEEFPFITVVVLGAIIIICLSPVFSQEYSLHTDAIILTTKYGKSTLIKAKIISAFLFATLVYICFAAINLGLYAAFFGMDGANSSIQLYAWYYQSPYNLTYGELYLTLLGLGYLGLMFMTAITLFISSRGKNPFISVVLSGLLLYVPNIDLSVQSHLAYKIMSLFPVNIMRANDDFELGVLYDFFGLILTQPVAMATAAFLGLVLLIPTAYRSFQRHEA
ncbi:hypothetical protein H1S01_15070 [Heliobacterium chlorum]|uniref:ABC transporter permease n=1 Tax=Heliobacterium chlorum TaxID=2698 RepID=A0ABR7T614_HELCL|nr:hypothetical protein [Heliobacterium chlorum]MBC9785805.1 hypothetical protein [Heliobacterium chlorum]